MQAVNDGPVLFVAYGSGHIGKVAPVMRHLQAQGVPCELLALTLGYRQAQKLGLSPKGFRDFLHLVDRDAVLARGAALAEGNRHPDVDEIESQAYLGVNYQEWVDTYGEEEAARRYRQGGRRSFFPLRFIGKVIDAVQPSVVVSTASPRSEQAAIEAARARGIPCMTMMDLFGLPHDNFVRNQVFADRITVLSGFARDNLKAAGIDPGKIAVTGCPAYEPLLEEGPREEAQRLRQSLGWQGLRVVMWAGNIEEEATGDDARHAGAALAMDVEQRLRAWVASTPDAALLVRYHPAQYHLFPDLGEQPRVFRSVPTRDPLVPQLHASDIVVVQTSTVGFEAALIGKRVLSLSYSPMVVRLDFDYGAMGLGESVRRPEDLVPTIETPPAGAADRSVFPPEGRATPRVAAEILALRQRICGA
jgi:hypothetical protein